MDYNAIINLMKEMNQTELTKLEVESEGFRVCLEKGNNLPAQSTAQYYPQYVGMPAGLPNLSEEMLQKQASTVLGQTTTSQAIANDTDSTGTMKIVSPMVGTFYGQAAPDKPPFANVGDKVKKGQTICIIEAMKLMNEIESEYDGEIMEVLVKNEDMVEFGQPLFVIR
ncbi:MAG TPA: acetyl-CoA carboxylase biotin carboxyl carrier protein [Mobilitalea sp.]|nr:acetyl-CoA carboxylase biotin carboxyl carrier protein [Mobilitalea sp.]HKL78992.1 acetyl-CoA carboxylase biotin carboxyl carrier protein [Mobilitalea sp.]